MPNVGKPSKSCKNCRDRKVKCDLKRPSCGQCIRVGKECYGYRDPVSIMFKNENDIVANKAQKRYKELSQKRTGFRSTATSFPASEPASETPSSDSCTSQQTLQTTSAQFQTSNPPVPMTPSIEDQALGFFAGNSIAQRHVALRGTWDWLLDILSHPDIDASFQYSAYAVSMASFANASKSPALLRKARQHYSTALTLTNTALSDPTKVYEDTTILSVMLLGLYENFMLEKYAPQAWIRHLKGAGTLLMLRGEAQFRNVMSQRIFTEFYRIFVNAGLELGLPIPDGVSRLLRILTSSDGYTTHGGENQVQIVTQAIKLMQTTSPFPATLVPQCLDLDRALSSKTLFSQPLWKSASLPLLTPAPNVFGKTYDVYLNPWVINMRNCLRTCRIRLLRFISREVHKGLQSAPPLFPPSVAAAHLRYCTTEIRTLILDLCASVPQLTGQIAFPQQITRGFDIQRGGIETVDLAADAYKIHPRGTFLEPFKATGLDHLIGPMYEVGRSGRCRRLTAWAADQLEFVAGRIGQRQAVNMAEMLREKVEREVEGDGWTDPCPNACLVDNPHIMAQV